jgi:hypothetical protein
MREMSYPVMLVCILICLWQIYNTLKKIIKTGTFKFAVPYDNTVYNLKKDLLKAIPFLLFQVGLSLALVVLFIIYTIHDVLHLL